ncbi:MFS transporter [Cellulomonas bogoriensis]|uniref:MFS transporter n=1 Tax=Cellulomonas bogoriensis 69B4 = DSM 16987 TaxID=1386082 RepID=A0A0A0BXC4_9CELL|nr:MFS transporter [Cellulomonas bogoriensis]KGM13058.1 MFS transporter [Cellulomonas bogoriensis 69B4 = DSM 16987]
MSVLGDLRTVAVHSGFRRLFTVRLVSQCGDGMFQIGLATLFFFSPERMATASDVAVAFAVLLLPFTVVGPFVGPLLDRWRRRQVLLLGNATRVVLAAATAVALITVGVGPAVYVLALVTLAVNRFLLAALSAGLPRVVPRDQLLMANTLTPTLGAISAVVGAGLGIALGLLVPVGPLQDGLVVVVAGLFFAAASALALRLGRDQLGPDAPGADLLQDLRATARDLLDGARYLVARRTPGAALTVMALHRFLYGVNFIALILISRNLLVDPADADAGLAMFGLLTAISFSGNGLAIVLTPLAHQRMSPATWVVVCLCLGAASQLVLATGYGFWVVVCAAVLIGLSIQGAKIAVDTIVHRDSHDGYRGRAFSLYDMLYNAAFVAAAALAALALPDTGWSRGVLLGLAAGHLVLAVAFRATPAEPRQVRSNV